MEKHKNFKSNFGFYMGVLIAAIGIFWVDKWWLVVFGLFVMILVRWMELDEDVD